MKQSKLNKRENQKVEDIPVYESSEAYKVGQIIYHPHFNDKGKIIKKMPSKTGKYKKIVVRFEKIGEKILVAEFK